MKSEIGLSESMTLDEAYVAGVADGESAKPFIWIKVEGGIADYGGDTDVVQVEHVDFDTEGVEPWELGQMIGAARRIPDRLAELPHDDPRWLDRDGIIETFTNELIEGLEHGICDDCDTVYELASRTDHCPEEGLCWEHCTEPGPHGHELRHGAEERGHRRNEPFCAECGVGGCAYDSDGNLIEGGAS